MSVMEMSHRGKEFVSILEQSVADLRELLQVPDNYKVGSTHQSSPSLVENPACTLIRLPLLGGQHCTQLLSRSASVDCCCASLQARLTCSLLRRSSTCRAEAPASLQGFPSTSQSLGTQWITL